VVEGRPDPWHSYYMSFSHVDAMWQLLFLECSHDKSFVENFFFADTFAKRNVSDASPSVVCFTLQQKLSKQ
jgi:hypothetical protein